MSLTKGNVNRELSFKSRTQITLTKPLEKRWMNINDVVIYHNIIRKYFFSCSCADITILYKMFAVKPVLSSGHSILFLQLHPWLLEVG